MDLAEKKLAVALLHAFLANISLSSNLDQLVCAAGAVYVEPASLRELRTRNLVDSVPKSPVALEAEKLVDDSLAHYAGSSVGVVLGMVFDRT
ncbi:hypothetical protein NM208_g612 [Fusarium decemcellulare]|uniref:Uncharacterized protein n=1 Tax=Fusarium decemcellulare TaxID=57161 RepID=A0ACC1SYZ9_9HYPO|nr:hypothetical protein NM208_g612 [Fusarium decemcellulare]